MAWRRPDDKPLSEPMMVSLPTHICVTRPQWVNQMRSGKKEGKYTSVSSVIIVSGSGLLHYRCQRIFVNKAIALSITVPTPNDYLFSTAPICSTTLIGWQGHRLSEFGMRHNPDTCAVTCYEAPFDINGGGASQKYSNGRDQCSMDTAYWKYWRQTLLIIWEPTRIFLKIVYNPGIKYLSNLQWGFQNLCTVIYIHMFPDKFV